MHPLLRILDSTAVAGADPSVFDLHPIQDAAPGRSRRIPSLLSLGLTPLLIYGLSLSLANPSAIQRARRTVDKAGRSVTLLLHEPILRPDVTEPVRNLLGPDGPGGKGHEAGTSTLDPRLAGIQTTTQIAPSEVIDPDELGTSPNAERVYLSLNSALPPQAGGNGLTRGTGRDAALGSGPDLLLIAIHQVDLTYQMAPGDGHLLTDPPQVRILIDADGVPFRATLVSGPEKLKDMAIKAALGWRFEPLGPHGLKAPLALTITFRRPH
ncbi:energy transducer TonB family protein [Geothrix fuzhouensis]|uniref:energy transducer TonB family protein n=1 Tax=Geothrix fuzhouensis TaxID=2966451 RepID=UPI002147B0BE|nr:energy transducer TonB [Geothrix fuzhouensis]